MLTIGERTFATSARRHRGSFAMLAPLLGALSAFRERAQQRRALAALDDHLLADIGLDRSTVEAEMTKPFWKA